MGYDHLDVIIHGLVMVLPLYIYGTIEIDITKLAMVT
jgi:hypothetical protein